MVTHVIKRDGSTEDFDAEKLSHWAEQSSVVGVNWQEIVLETFTRLDAICTTKQLQQALIQTCNDRKTTGALLMAGHLYLGGVYKDCFGTIDNIPNLPTFYSDMVLLGYWEDMGYNDDELRTIDTYLDHSLDANYNYSQLKQIVNKYSAQDRVSGVLFESPQFTFIRMAMGCAKVENNSSVKLKDVKEWYVKFAETQTINAPTPNYVNLGTQGRGYASCCLIKAGDDAKSIAVATFIADQMTCASAGIGHHLTSRSIGDPVRGGVIQHNGKLPYLRALQSAVHANVQGSRGGSATTYITCNDPEIMDLLKARSVTTVAEKRVGGIDYNFGHVAEFRRRVALDLDWPLFSYYHEPDLYNAMYDNDKDFQIMLEDYISNNDCTMVPARDILLTALKEELETGRSYEHNIDEINRHTSFKEIIYSSNLCVEVVQVTKAYDSLEQLFVKEESGEISTCTLAAIIQGKLQLEFKDDGGFTQHSIDLYTNECYYALKMIDNIIDIMEYPFPQLEFTAKARRNSGVGISNLAYDMANRGLKYSSVEGKEYIHKISELHSYCLHKAALQLTQERGVCDWTHKTKYPDGWLPIDTYNKNVDTVVNTPLFMDWEQLRSDIVAAGGLRFSSLVAHMPCESSSGASATTNSVYPIRRGIVTKTSGTSKSTFIAPEFERLQDDYEFAWDVPVKDMIEVYAIIQKFTDQAISADYWPSKEDNGTFSGDKAVEEFLYAAWLGVKTKYYTNTRNGGEIEQESEDCSGGGCKM